MWPLRGASLHETHGGRRLLGVHTRDQHNLIVPGGRGRHHPHFSQDVLRLHEVALPEGAEGESAGHTPDFHPVHPSGSARTPGVHVGREPSTVHLSPKTDCWNQGGEEDRLADAGGRHDAFRECDERPGARSFLLRLDRRASLSWVHMLDTAAHVPGHNGEERRGAVRQVCYLVRSVPDDRVWVDFCAARADRGCFTKDSEVGCAGYFWDPARPTTGECSPGGTAGSGSELVSIVHAAAIFTPDGIQTCAVASAAGGTVADAFCRAVSGVLSPPTHAFLSLSFLHTVFFTFPGPQSRLFPPAKRTRAHAHLMKRRGGWNPPVFRVFVGYAFDSTCGFPGEGPPSRRRQSSVAGQSRVGGGLFGSTPYRARPDIPSSAGGSSTSTPKKARFTYTVAWLLATLMPETVTASVDILHAAGCEYVVTLLNKKSSHKCAALA